jgi:hypothetical protein
VKLTRTDFCPLIKEPCRQLGCNWFVKMRGLNPNTGEEIDDYRCTLSWLPILLLEGASQTRQAGAAIESFRNEVAQGQRDAALGIAHARSEPPLKVIGKIEAAE